MTAPRIEPLDEVSLCLRWDQRIEASVNDSVHGAVAALRRARLQGLIDLIPAYASLALVFDPQLALSDPRWLPRVAAKVAGVLANASPAADESSACIEVPVCYGGRYGADLDSLSHELKISAASLIERHCAPLYRVAMLGFAPGFPYLLGLDPGLQAPRLAQPRAQVPAGSVGIAGAQTGIYPAASPGGWRLIGRTPWRLFDPQRVTPARLQPGNRLRFVAIDSAEFERLNELAE